MARFVVAVRRGLKGSGRKASRAAAFPGVKMIADQNPERVVVEGTLDDIAVARAACDDELIFEPVISYDKSAEA